MKKMIVTLAIVVVAFSGYAVAEEGLGFGGGEELQQPSCGCAAGGAQVQAISPEEASAAINSFVAENFEGAKVESITPFPMPMGTVYSAVIVTANDVKLGLHLNPFGFVVGPYPVQ